jgi:hypothetical protein
MVAACGVAKGGVEARRRLVASQTEGAKGMTTACGVAKGGVEASRRHVGDDVASQTEGTKKKAAACGIAAAAVSPRGCLASRSPLWSDFLAQVMPCKLDSS